MFTFSPGLQHLQPQNVTKSADGEERKKPKGRSDGEDVGTICYTSDDARPLLALSASVTLSWKIHVRLIKMHHFYKPHHQSRPAD